ncbi:hypothetical protein [Mesorhizobium tianshanense]|uniref:hypothetical protein n=1 Tax=Mesorhizobium tianshanense TaxID=39844 RepID=UPI00119CAEC0|nr:hypothetical protein [Mesorhizobium tianshanense]
MGQTGEFIIEHEGMRVRIDLNGIFGIGSSVGFWPGFAADAVDLDKPFLSQAGYCSFLGIHADPAPGLLPGEFVSRVIAGYVRSGLKGRLKPIEARYRERAS